MRLRFWCHVCDLCHWLHRLTNKLYFWSVEKMGNANDWGDPLPEDDGEAPF